MIKRLKQSPEKYGTILAGVGDRPSDMEAYAVNGLHALMITDELGEMGEGHAEALVDKEKELIESGASIEYFGSSSEAGLAWEQIARRLGELEGEQEQEREEEEQRRQGRGAGRPAAVE